jgi:hypothetical protein
MRNEDRALDREISTTVSLRKFLAISTDPLCDRLNVAAEPIAAEPIAAEPILDQICDGIDFTASHNLVRLYAPALPRDSAFAPIAPRGGPLPISFVLLQRARLALPAERLESLL